MLPRMGPFGARLFASVFMLIGGFIASTGVKALLQGQASRSWPTVPGRVLESGLDASRSDKGRTTYRAEVLYEFQVDGQTYASNDIAVGDYGSSDPKHGRRIANRYPKGAAVTVHYDPDDPETSLLEAGIQGQAFFLPGFGLLFFGAGLVVFIFLPRSMARKRARMEELRRQQELGSAAVFGRGIP